MRTKLKMHIMIEALILCLILTAIFLMTPFVNRVRYTYASAGDKPFGDYDPYDYFGMEGEELQQYIDSHLSNNDVSDDKIEEMEQKAEEIFIDYLYFDGGYLNLDTESIERDFANNYSEIYNTYGNLYNLDYWVIGDEMRQNIEESMVEYYGEEVAEELKFNIGTVSYIKNNIDLMNRLTDEEVGYITNDYEFEFFESDDYVELWRVWGFKLKWNKITANFDSNWATVFSLITLIITFGDFCRDLNDAVCALSNEYVINDIILLAYNNTPGELTDSIIGLFNNKVLGILASIVSIASGILSSGSLVYRIIKIVISFLMPSTIDSLLVLFNSLLFNAGVQLTACWIPTWWDKWGISIKSI